MQKKIGCLIIHGFGGSLDEIDTLNQFLISKGFDTACPVLKGHALTKKDMANATYTDWICSAEEALIELSKKHDKIVIIGFSMGGLVAVNLAMKYKVYKLITLSSPIYHWDFKMVCQNILNDIKMKKPGIIRNYIDAAFSVPISAVVNFKVLLQKTKPMFNEVTCPIYVAQGLKDDTVKPISANYIYENVASHKKHIKFYQNSPHVICNGEDNEELFRDVVGFINFI